MCSLDIFAVLIVLLLVLIIMTKLKKQEKKKEYLIRDYRPNVYLIYSTDPAQCKDCQDLADRFLLLVGRRDRYVAHIWDVKFAKAAIQKFEKEHQIKIRTLPTMIVERDGVLIPYEGTEIIRVGIKDIA